MNSREHDILPTADEALLASDEPAPYTILDGTPSWPVLLVCDHASNRIPRCLNQLGLAEADLNKHMGLDIGAGAVTRCLSARLGLPAVMANYSRLVVDYNRRLNDPDAFPKRVDGVTVPGNVVLSHAERQRRAEALYWPYHHAIRDQLTALEALAPAPALVAVHSFTPVLEEEPRHWHFGILWDKDPRIPLQVIAALRALPGLEVGDNQPYSGRHPSDFTVDHHAEAEGLPHVGIELRQDLVATAEGAQRWGDSLAEVLAPILADPALYTHWPGTT